MGRRLSNTVCLLSLVLAVAAAALWVGNLWRSYSVQVGGLPLPGSSVHVYVYALGDGLGVDAH